MGIPQIIIIVLIGIGLLLAANLHGKPKGNYNFWSTLFAAAVEVGLLYWAGFFN